MGESSLHLLQGTLPMTCRPHEHGIHTSVEECSAVTAENCFLLFMMIIILGITFMLIEGEKRLSQPLSAPASLPE